MASRTTLRAVFGGLLLLAAAPSLLTGCGPLIEGELCGPIANSTASTSFGLKATALGGGNGRLANKFYWPTSTLNVKRIDLGLKQTGALDGFTLTLTVNDDNGSGTQPSGTTLFTSPIVLNDDVSPPPGTTDVSKTQFEWITFEPNCYAPLDRHSSGDPALYWLVLSADYSSSNTDRILWGAQTNASNPVAAFKELNALGWQLFDYPTNTGTQDFLFRFFCVDTSDPVDAALLPCP